ncbi:hypothetical protein NBRC116602_07370 [Hyphomicrobiales bacterium 4NK60-0047b]|jgi:SAM-dependent methyltransferase
MRSKSDQSLKVGCEYQAQDTKGLGEKIRDVELRTRYHNDNGLQQDDTNVDLDKALGQRFDTGFFPGSGLYPGNFLLGRQHILPQASGDIMEIGVRRGRNLPYYKSDKVRSYIGVDHSPNVRKICHMARKVNFPVEVVTSMPDALSLPSESMDCVVSTYTLCSVKHPQKVMSEIWRVLRPGGMLLFCEEGRHPSRHVAFLQDKLTPLWRRFSFGRSLNRNMFRLISGAGFKMDFFEMDRPPLKPLILGYHYAGIAVKT